MPQQRQVGRGEALVVPTDLLRLAQLLAAPQPHLEAQRCGHLVISPQLRQQRLRRRPQLIADAAEVLVTAQLESAIAARGVRWGGNKDGNRARG